VRLAVRISVNVHITFGDGDQQNATTAFALADPDFGACLLLTMTSESTHPDSLPDAPQYILVSHTSLSSASNTGPVHSTLSHPIIQYVYADDGPTAALPRFPGEQVLVIDCDSTSGSSEPHARSLVPGLAVTGVKVSVAPGAGLVDVEAPIGDNKMYVIETVHTGDER
jgi:hypothetical protein